MTIKLADILSPLFVLQSESSQNFNITSMSLNLYFPDFVSDEKNEDLNHVDYN